MASARRRRSTARRRRVFVACRHAHSHAGSGTPLWRKLLYGRDQNRCSSTSFRPATNVAHLSVKSRLQSPPKYSRTHGIFCAYFEITADSDILSSGTITGAESDAPNMAYE